MTVATSDTRADTGGWMEAGQMVVDDEVEPLCLLLMVVQTPPLGPCANGNDLHLDDIGAQLRNWT